MTHTSQRDRVLNMLQSGRWVSVKDFMLAGISRFGARIWELRQSGVQIESREEHKGRSRHVSYRLIPKGQRELF